MGFFFQIADQFLELNFCVSLGLGLLFLKIAMFGPQIRYLFTAL